MKTLSTLLITALTALLAGCINPGMSYRNFISTEGIIENGRYHAPNSAFTFAVPQLIQPGARIADNVDSTGKGGDVYFQDDMGTWVNIVYIRLPQDRIDTKTERDELSKKFLSGTESEVLHQETLQSDKLFAVLKFPEGSNLADMETGRNLDLIEGVLVFFQNEHIFRLSSQSSRAILSPEELSLTDHIDYLRPEILNLYSTLEFPKNEINEVEQ